MGDYVLGFTLPAPDAPVPDTTAGDLTGQWVGEIHIGDARGGMHVELRPAGDSLVATAQFDSVTLTGPVTVRRKGREVTLAFPFHYPAKHDCTATLAMTLALWNGGRLLEGGGTVDGPCADHGHQDAAFVFERPR
jgi:hypothetical protein